MKVDFEREDCLMEEFENKKIVKMLGVCEVGSKM
jgi:hypothetical protein